MNDETLIFIKSCIRQRKIIWTYHVNMRLQERAITRETILSSVETYEFIEHYPDDKYFPSYLLYAQFKGDILHIHIAVDKQGGNVRIITAYKPTLDTWESDYKTRRKL